MLSAVDERYPWLRERLLAPAAMDVNPDLVTGSAFVVGVGAGAAFAAGRPLLAAVFVLLNGYLDLLDGFIARRIGPTARGDVLDHVADRLVDMAMLLGLAVSPGVPPLLGAVTAVMVLLVSYLGTQAQAVLEERVYGGFVGRSDRMVLLAVGGAAQLVHPAALYWTVVVLLAASVVTFGQRFAAILRALD